MKNILFVKLAAALGHQVIKVHALDINAFLNTLFEIFDDCITRLHWYPLGRLNESFYIPVLPLSGLQLSNAFHDTPTPSGNPTDRNRRG